MFNSLDKSLLDRTIRILLQASSDLKTSSTLNGAWPNTADGRKDKRLCDSYARDARDLKNLSQRMINEAGDESVAKYRKGANATKEVGDFPAESPDGVHGTLTRMGIATEHPADNLGTGAGSGFPTAAELMAGSGGAIPGPVAEEITRNVTDWEADAHAIGRELLVYGGMDESGAVINQHRPARTEEQFEQCAPVAGPPADLADQAAVVVGDQG